MITQSCSDASTMKHRNTILLITAIDRSHRAADNEVSVTLRHQPHHKRIYVVVFKVMSVAGMLRNKVSVSEGNCLTSSQMVCS
jgi:hypothetical protein